MRRVIAILFILVLILGACGDDRGTPESTDSADRSVADETTVPADPTSTDSLVAFEAGWQCERERHAFDELEDLASRLDATREAAGISAEVYEAFQETLAGDGELRQQVLAAYRVECS